MQLDIIFGKSPDGVLFGLTMFHFSLIENFRYIVVYREYMQINRTLSRPETVVVSEIIACFVSVKFAIISRKGERQGEVIADAREVVENLRRKQCFDQYKIVYNWRDRKK